MEKVCYIETKFYQEMIDFIAYKIESSSKG